MSTPDTLAEAKAGKHWDLGGSGYEAYGYTAGGPPPRPTTVRPLGTRLFTPADSKLPEGYGAIAVFVFPQRPVESSDRERYLRFCRSYVGVLPDAAAARAVDPDRPQMVTVWPRHDLSGYLKVEAPADDRTLTSVCQTAVQNYAYEAADRWMARIPRAEKLEGRRGPFLIAWAPPQSFSDPRAPLLVYDLSDFELQPEINDAFGLWKARIEGNPELWARGWDMTRWRLFLRASVDRYAPTILSGLKLVSVPK